MSKFFSTSITIILVAGILFALNPPTAAKAEIGLDLGGGLTVPIGDLNDSHNMGFGARGAFYVPFSPVAAFGLGVGYSFFQADENLAPQGEQYSGGDFSTLSVCPELRFMVGAAGMPNFSASIGAGLYRLMQSDLDIEDLVVPANSGTVEFNSVNKFGMNIAGRVLFPVGPTVKIGLEAKDHLIFTDEDSLNFFEFMVVLNISVGP
ncbi:MAG: hypothetical protein ABIA59_07540 [Candidatus Latescibacterota bacterium]